MTESADNLLRQAIVSLQAGQVGNAERSFEKLLKLQPKHIGGLNLFGILLTKLGRFEEAEHYVARALQENAASDATHYNHGIILKALKRPAEALESFNRALAINPAVAETWNNRGTVFNELKHYDAAIADFDQAIATNPNYAEAYYNKGKSLARRGQYEESVGALEKALALNPNFAEAWLGRGDIYSELEQYDKALAAYDKALSLRADLAEARLNRGNVFVTLKQYADALAEFDKALALKPDLAFGEGARFHAKLLMCDWTNFEAEASRLVAAIRNQITAALPFALLSIPAAAPDQLTCAKIFGAQQPLFAKMWNGERYSHDRIRIAYLSSDLHEHAVGHLVAGLFELHDTSRFETTAISFGPYRDSALRHRIKNAFEHFIDVRSHNDGQIADLIRRNEVDIAIDLNGYTQGGRSSILARRPAPIQVNYLGYPGTMGADFIDYIIGDRVIIPEDQRAFYSEKVVWLPHSYQANDLPRQAPERAPTRGECALPENAFVFACFNHTYKITPDIFDIWMRLLMATDGSVLWLLADNPAATANLSREAEKRGVSSGRLIFAPRVAFEDHLARQRQADLFLDTLPYNAHTTASDALWAGLPVLTCRGTTFAGRVAASLLQAVGLDELVTASLEDYEALALKLAKDPALLASLKHKLAGNRDRYPLFDTARFTRHIEAAYTMMWERHQKGLAPDHFTVEPAAS
jgi:protein O-GlcNAc transferase